MSLFWLLGFFPVTFLFVLALQALDRLDDDNWWSTPLKATGFMFILCMFVVGIMGLLVLAFGFPSALQVR